MWGWGFEAIDLDWKKLIGKDVGKAASENIWKRW